MSEPPKNKTKENKTQARHARQAAALRRNLHRRKAQSQARKAQSQAHKAPSAEGDDGLKK